MIQKMEKERQIGGRQIGRQMTAKSKWERGQREQERSNSYILFLEGRLQVKFIFDVPKESNFPYILKAFNRYLLN